MRGQRSGGVLPLSTALTISRPSGGDGGERITVSVVDRTSRSSIVEVDVSLADFALALTGRGYVECSGRVWPGALARLGMTRENGTRTLIIDSTPTSEPWAERVAAAWRDQYDVDEANGWVIFGLDERPNSHRRGRTESGEPTYQISVERYVEATS